MIAIETAEHILADFDRLITRTEKELAASKLADIESLASFDLTVEALAEAQLSRSSDATVGLQKKLKTIEIAKEWFVEDNQFESVSVDYHQRRQEALRDRKGHTLDTTEQRRIRAVKQGEIDGYSEAIHLFAAYVEAV